MKNFLAIPIVVALASLILFRPVTDPDFGWHYKYGEYFFNHGNVLKDNIFSYTMPNYKWPNSYWLSELLLYASAQTFGLVGSGIFLGSMFTLFHLVIFTKYASEKWFYFASAIYFVFLSSFAVTVRVAFLVSSAFLLLLLYILYERRRLYFLLPVLFLVWANAHADFTLGLFCLAIVNIFNLAKKSKNTGLLVYSLFAVFVTVINPWGFKLWETMLLEGWSIEKSALEISEWLPISTRDTQLYLFFFIFSSLFLASAFVAFRLKKIDVPYLVLCIVFYILAFRYGYMLRVLGVICFLPLLYLTQELAKVVRIAKGRGVKVAHYFIVFIFVVSVMQGFLSNLALALDDRKLAASRGYPIQELDYLTAQNFTGNILNAYEWGGYILWKYPGYKTFIDGRMTNWIDDDGTYVAKDYRYILNNKNISSKLFDSYQKKYSISAVLVKKTYPICEWLEQWGWVRVDVDGPGCLYIKPQ